MPLYEYRCTACGRKSEELVLAGDTAAPPRCPSCGSPELSRLLSTFAASSAGSKRETGFDPQTACGGGACQMPDVCGSGMDEF